MSGSKEGIEFYSKMFFDDKSYVALDIVYPSAKRFKYDKMVEQISRDFIPFLEGEFDR